MSFQRFNMENDVVENQRRLLYQVDCGQVEENTNFILYSIKFWKQTESSFRCIQ